MSINARIKELRKSLSLNQTDFAARLQLKQSALSTIESGAGGVTEQNIRLICSTFGVSEDWLRNGEGDMYAPNIEGNKKDPLAVWADELVRRGEKSAFPYRMASALSELQPEQWEVLEDIFDKMVNQELEDISDIQEPTMTMEEKAALYDAEQEARRLESSSSLETTSSQYVSNSN